MGLILQQQMVLIVTYIYKIKNLNKSPYRKVNLELIYAFRFAIKLIAINNQLDFKFFYLTKINWNNVTLR